MIYRATEEIYEEFQQKDFHGRIAEGKESSRVIAGISGKFNSYELQFISYDDDSDVAVRAFDLIKFPEEKLPEIRRLANAYNLEYRFVKFTIDAEHFTVDMGYDFPEHTDNVGELAVECIIRFMRIVDDVYPTFMRCVWRTDNTNDPARSVLTNYHASDSFTEDDENDDEIHNLLFP